MAVAILAGVSPATGKAGHMVGRVGKRRERTHPSDVWKCVLPIGQDGSWICQNKEKKGSKVAESQPVSREGPN